LSATKPSYAGKSVASWFEGDECRQKGAFDVYKIMIGCPVRNRGWILPRYLKCLENLDYPENLKRYAFVINNCSDDTEHILEAFAQKHPGRVELIYENVPGSRGHRRGSYSLKALAHLRNLLLQTFLISDCDYLLSVDSDILMPPSSLRQLLADDLHIVSALVCNGHQIGDENIYNVLMREKENYQHILNFPRHRVFPVDCTGAAYLIKREVIEKGARYSAECGAEDIGFCQMAFQLGYKIYCDGRIEGEHVMAEQD